MLPIVPVSSYLSLCPGSPYAGRVGWGQGWVQEEKKRFEGKEGYWEALNFQAQHLEEQRLEASVPQWPSMEHI